MVGAKVLHLGDQLDSVNGPRSRVVEAQKLITHLNEFLSPQTYTINNSKVSYEEATCEMHFVTCYFVDR